MTRRQFLAGALGLVLASLLPRLPEVKPSLSKAIVAIKVKATDYILLDGDLIDNFKIKPLMAMAPVCYNPKKDYIVTRIFGDYHAMQGQLWVDHQAGEIYRYEGVEWVLQRSKK